MPLLRISQYSQESTCVGFSFCKVVGFQASVYNLKVNPKFLDQRFFFLETETIKKNRFGLKF